LQASFGKAKLVFRVVVKASLAVRWLVSLSIGVLLVVGQAEARAGFDAQGRLLMNGVPRFMLGVYDSNSDGYSPDPAFWEDHIFSPTVTGSRGLQGFPLNLYLSYFLGGMPIDSTNALLDVLNNHGMMYLQTGNCSGNGSWTRFGPGSFSIMDQTYVQQFALHTAAAGYYIMDECAESLIPETEAHHQQLKMWDPAGITFSAIVAGVPPGNQNVGDPSLWNNASDVLGTDPYPLFGMEESVGYPHFIVGDFISKLRAVAPPARPVWSVLQFFKFTSDSRLPTPAEMRAHALMSIVEGAQGIFWWDIGVNGIRQEDAATVSTYMNHLKTLTTELAGLEQALLAQPSQEALVGNSTRFSDQIAGRISQLDQNRAVDFFYSFSRSQWYQAEKTALQNGDTSKSGGMLDGAANVRTLTKLVGNVGHVFAYNYTNQSQPVTFTWRGQLVSVVENKSGQNFPVSGATWSDTFGPYEARIYVVTSQLFPLTVNRLGAGTGMVVSSPAGINCGGVCTASFGDGAVVTLTATASAGSIFAGWSGGGCSGTGPCTVTVTSATTVTATFDQAFTLTVAVTGSGSGMVTSAPAGITCPSTCAAAYSAGTGVTLTAAATGDSVFAGWSGGGCSGTGQCNVTLGANTTVTAVFSRMSTLSVTVTGSGTVTSSPAGIACPPTCTAGFDASITVKLTAVAAARATFSGWSGDCAGTTSCTLAMTTARSAGATFVTSFSGTFTDDPLVAGITLIKAVHVTELRLAIDQERTRRGLAAFTWTDPVLTPGIRVVSAIHLAELRAALNAAYQAASRPLPGYTDALIVARSLRVRAVHIQELRAAVRALQ
jgi:List-Bact-rpt repeat protein